MRFQLNWLRKNELGPHRKRSKTFGNMFGNTLDKIFDNNFGCKNATCQQYLLKLVCKFVYQHIYRLVFQYVCKLV